MPDKGSIIILDSDLDDQKLLQELFQQLGVVNKLCFFQDGSEALNYLKTTRETPFLIISEQTSSR